MTHLKTTSSLFLLDGLSESSLQCICFGVLYFKFLWKHFGFNCTSAHYLGGTWWRSWLRHCATSRQVAVSIPDGVTGIFHWHNSSPPHYGPGIDSTSNRNEYHEYFLGGKGCRCVRLTTLPPSCADCLEIWEPQPSGTLRVCPAL